MSAVYKSDVSLEHATLDASKVIEGSPTTGFLQLGSTEKLNTGIWEHSVGVSIDIEVDEVFVILEGKGRIILKSGEILHLEKGVVGTLKAGEETRWEIDETLKKLWIMPK